MKSIFTVSFSLIVFVLLSCGPNAEQKAKMQKAHDDSIAQVSQQNQRLQDIDAQNRSAAVADLKTYHQQLEEMIADYNVEQNELRDIEGFKALRTKAEKDAQIKQQTLKMEQLKDKIQQLKGVISQAEIQANK